MFGAILETGIIVGVHQHFWEHARTLKGTSSLSLVRQIHIKLKGSHVCVMKQRIA